MLFHEVSAGLARSAVGDWTVQSMRVGRMTALRKAEGVRGTVARDVVSSHMSRMVAQQFDALMPLNLDGGAPVISFARMFHGRPSPDLCEE